MLIWLAAAGIFLPDLKAEPSYDYPTQAPGSSALAWHEQKSLILQKFLKYLPTRLLNKGVH
jgi:hypothetical protein